MPIAGNLLLTIPGDRCNAAADLHGFATYSPEIAALHLREGMPSVRAMREEVGTGSIPNAPGWSRIVFSIPVTNTSVNPARSTGPALFVGGWAIGQLWLFWIAPILGGAAGGVLYHWLSEEPSAQVTGTTTTGKET